MKTNLLKSIFISLILILGVSNAWAITFSGGYVYFDNTNTNWSGVFELVAHQYKNKDYIGCTTMSKILGTNNLYYVANPSGTNWGDIWGWRVMCNAAAWGSQDCSESNLKQYATHYTASDNSNGLTSGYSYLCYGANANNNCTLTRTSLGNTSTQYNSLNYTQAVEQHLSTNNGSSYAASTTSIATVKVTANKLNGRNTTTSNSGTIASGSSSATCSAARTATVTYTVSSVKKGYTFVGWYDGTTQKSDTTTYDELKATGAKTITARFKLNQHTVTWKANGGNWSGSTADKVATYNYGATISEQAEPTRDGYEFAGWSPEFVANTTMPDNDLTYTAQWTANTYDVTLDPQSGTGGTTSVTATYGSEMPAITKPTRTGYTFNGYFDATSGGTKYYNADGSSARTWNKTAATTLYAQWTINEYTITYGVFEGANGTIQLDGGDKVTSSTKTTAEYNTPHTLVAEPDNNETHKREGWYSDVACTKKIADGSSNTYPFTLTNDMTVYVKFIEADEKTYPVTVDANKGGTVSPSGTVEVGSRTPTTFTATPDPGYRFDHWDIEGGIVAPQDLTNPTISITATGEGTLTAHFVRVYTVKYYATPTAAGSVTAKVDVNDINSGDEFAAETEITFTATPANNECKFIKWVDGAGKQLSTQSPYRHTVTDDITIKGIFKINQYTLTFSAGEGGHVSATANNSAIASPATLDYNTSVTLTAEPDAGCAFVKWVDGADKQLSTNATYTIDLKSNQTVKAVFNKGTTVYMKAIEYWKKDHPRYAIYYWKNDANGWEDMTNVDCNGDIYEGYVPAGYTNFKFVRLAPSTSNDWANMWNETPNLTTSNNDGKMYIYPHVYLKPSSNWKSDGARFAARFWNDGGGETWMSMNDLDGDGVYSCEIPTGYAKVIFVRMNGSSTENNWDNKWNQTIDLDVPTNNNILYTLTNSSWESGTWSAGPHKNGWQTYAKPSYKITYSKPTNGTITVTTKAGAAIKSGDELTMGDEIKITFTPADSYELINYNVDYATETGEEGVYTVCGPTKITAEFAKAGTARTVYLRPNEDWLRDEPIFAAYAWNSNSKAQYHWYIMTTKADDYTGAYSCNISSTYDWVIFVRIKPAGRDGSDGSLKFENAWNQTKDLAIIDKDNDKTNDNKLRCAISNQISEGNDKNKYDVKWEENTPIWGMIANFNDWKAEKAVFKGYPGHLDVMPPFGTSHAFKLYNFFGVKDQSEYFGNAGTMKRANSGQWWTMDATEQANCQMTLDVKGDYIYQMRFLTVGTELRKQISVTYPAAEMYYIMYEETGENDAVKQRISYGIRLTGEERLDTVSFFVDVTKSAKIYILDGNQNKVGDPYTIVGTIGQNPTGAQAPQRRAENNPELLIEEGCGITESGVYNFVAQQDANNKVTLLINDWHAYTGAYYIRTDAASGGWGGYKQNGNKMTYTSYADKNHNFDHYYCKWVESSQSSYANVKFCVANDYSHKLSDELDGDEIIEKAGVHTGCLPANANVRFGWDSKTNELSRAYISGSATASDRFLVLEGNEHLKAVDGSALNVSGLNPNEAIFADRQNWIYQLDVQANPLTDISLTAQFNGKIQTFFGTAKGMMQATNEDYHKVRMIYDFKTNNLIAAWLLDPEQEIEAETVASNMLIIREDQGTANQITFTNQSNSVEINTAYGVMTFTQTHITDNQKTQRERSLYWISFPFDVKIDDVFGLGIGEYADQWIIQRYNGAARAEKGLFGDSGTYWEYIFDKNTILRAGEGYVLVLDLKKIQFLHGATDVSLYFPSLNKTNILIGALPTTFTVPEHECTIDRTFEDGGKTYNHKFTDSHWNLIGVPGFIDQTWTEEKVKQYSFMQDDVSFYYNFNLADSRYNVQSTATTFKAMYAYMVQFAGNIDWSTQALAPTPAELAARRNSDVKPEKVVLRLELAQGQEVADRTFIQLQQEGATADFDLSLDLSKIINAGSNIYTIVGEDRTPAAGNVLPFEETTVAVGVDIATAGEYTFRMPDGTEGMVVELIDYETNTTTNLLLNDYTVNLPAGSNETRFALSLKPEKAATSIESTTTPSDSNTRKFIIDGKLYLQKDGMLYDAQGKLVR